MLHKKSYKESDIISIKKKVKRKVSKKRYQHILGVAYTAAALAMRYEEDILKAQIAGVLHDCAKGIRGDKMVELCDHYHITISDVERKNTELLHAKLGGFLAMKRYHIQDKEIIGAILAHTTGHPNMTTLEKIIFIADYIEPGRYKQKNLKMIRYEAFRDLDACLLMILRDTLEYLQETGTEIDPMTQQTYEYYTEQLNKTEKGEKNESI